jgi:hypothetical protein
MPIFTACEMAGQNRNAEAPRSPREVEEKSCLLEIIGEGELEPRMKANGREGEEG